MPDRVRVAWAPVHAPSPRARLRGEVGQRVLRCGPMFYVPEYIGSLYDWIVIVLAVTFPVFFITEATGWLSFGYSKFAKREQRFSLPSRPAMLIVYFPAVVIFPIVYVSGGAPDTTWHLVAMVLISLHFAKRCLESLFVHRYSGVMNGWTVVTICGIYSLVSWLLGEIATNQVPPALVQAEGFEHLFWPGLALWLLGTAANLWHHVLLARLRGPDETAYKLPTAGLFRYVACPHYLGEIVAWWGYALIFHHVAAAVVSLTMTAYLAGRAYNTVKWYRARVEGVPRNWKRLVPMIY